MNLLDTAILEPGSKHNCADVGKARITGQDFQTLPEGVAGLPIHVLLAHPVLLLWMSGSNEVLSVSQTVGGVS